MLNTMEYTYDFPNQVTFKSIEGDVMKTLNGRYFFAPVEGKPSRTEVTYELALEFGFPLPSMVRSTVRGVGHAPHGYVHMRCSFSSSLSCMIRFRIKFATRCVRILLTRDMCSDLWSHYAYGFECLQVPHRNAVEMSMCSLNRVAQWEGAWRKRMRCAH